MRFTIVGWMLLIVGCTTPRVVGSLEVDGRPFAPTDCRTGARYRYTGVELGDTSGRRLRASIGPRRFSLVHPSPPDTGVPLVTVLEPGDESGGQPVGYCGSLTVGEEMSKMPLRDVEGKADLSCRSDQHSVVGHVEFENCH
jgi:hypothetical protein